MVQTTVLAHSHVVYVAPSKTLSTGTKGVHPLPTYDHIWSASLPAQLHWLAANPWSAQDLPSALSEVERVRVGSSDAALVRHAIALIRVRALSHTDPSS
jgi:hypothetical protein